ncbi:MAG: 16S rRNA (uracil(1498)-N(3))-methyltransferase [Phycisphaeraceae bacterium]|nr:16S rRNA (uracil(1498)-N(3))-methyltransferase [Phycisphaeraceae bacterium]
MTPSPLSSRPPRFYCPQLPHPRLSDRFCSLDAQESRHARKVLRLEVGDPVELFDGRGGLAHATIEEFDSSTTLCHVVSVESLDKPRPYITVATAVPKGPRADDMINQLSQVGADRVIPLRCERSIVEPRIGKLDRFERQAVESAKQSGRLFFMAIDEPRDFADVLTEPRDLALIATPGSAPAPGNASQINSDLEKRLRVPEGVGRILLLIGPEGGWSDDELRHAVSAGFHAWSFSPNVLRIETAATVAVALLRYLCM